MLRKIPFVFAVNSTIVLLGGVFVFHILVLAGVIPFEVVWGGYVLRLLPAKTLTVLLWVYVAIFALNTVGNVFALTTIEALVGTPLTLATALCCWRMAVEPWPP